MKLDLTFPASGQRLALPELAGSSDSLAIAQLADTKHTLMLVTASGADVQRYADEIAWWAKELGRELRVAVFPDWETLPYDTFSPHQDLVSERLATLNRLAEREVDVLIVGATTALQRLAPPSFMAAYTFAFTQGQKLDAEKLRAQLVLAGYSNVSQVMSPGEYAVRGGLIDLFPMGSVVPYRIDLFDDEIESIRTFDVDTQRSLYPVKDVRLLPGREFPLDEPSRTAFRKRFREAFEGDPSRSTIYKDIAHGVAGAGIEYYLPLFFDETATLLRYLPSDARIALAGDVDAAIRRFWSDTQSRYRFLAADRERPILPPESLYLSSEDFFTLAKPHARVTLHGGGDYGTLARPLPSLGVDRRANDPIAGLRQFATTAHGKILIVAESLGRRDTMHEFFAEYGFKPASVESFLGFIESDIRLGLGVAPLATGFSLGDGDDAIHIITEAELYASGMRRAGRRKQEQVTAVDAII
ncbi:MAG TPA: transcription-repair coupling factor, partial [Burkholderiaceae bacterium]|nr:transcription-repair coupling factor [Burkholderiaceae bacterium]